MKITLTENAKIKIISETEQGSYLKVMLNRAGCCSYALQFLPWKREAGDISVDIDGVTVHVAESAVEFLNNVQIDYKTKGIRKGFHIIPQ